MSKQTTWVLRFRSIEIEIVDGEVTHFSAESDPVQFGERLERAAQLTQPRKRKRTAKKRARR